MVDRLRVLRAWILRRSLLAGVPLVLAAAMLAWVVVSGAYPVWLKAIVAPILLVPICALSMDLVDVVARARRRRSRAAAEWAQPASAILLVLLIAAVPRFLVPVRETASEPAPLPVRRPLPAPAPMEQATTVPAAPPEFRDVAMSLLEPLEREFAPDPVPEYVPPPPPPLAPVAAAPDVPSPASDELEGLRFRPVLEDLVAFGDLSSERRSLALPTSFRVEMALYLEDSERAEGSAFLAELDYALSLDEGVRVFFQTSAESQDEGLFDDGPTWGWQRARIDYVRRVPFFESIDLRVSAGLAFDRFRLTQEIGISEARGGAPVLGIEATLLDEGPVRFVFHAAYTPATDLAGHHAVVTELGATAFIRVTDAVHLTIGWRFLELRLREDVDGLTRRWDDEVSGPAFGFEIRL